MNDSSQSRQPVWMNVALVAVLSTQAGLLWVQGGLLNRQHGDIQGMRHDIQDLTESLDNYSNDQGQDPEEGSFQPASAIARAHSTRHQRRHHGLKRLQRTGYVSNLGKVDTVMQDSQAKPPDDDEQVAKELQESRDSAKKAVAKSYDTQQKLSISENIRKADEKKKIEDAKGSYLPFVYGAMFLGLLAFILGRMWRARSGGR